MELYDRVTLLGFSMDSLSDIYYKGGNLKKAKFHIEAVAMAGRSSQKTKLESWSIIQETWNKLSKSRQLGHQLEVMRLSPFEFEESEGDVVGRESMDSILVAMGFCPKPKNVPYFFLFFYVTLCRNSINFFLAYMVDNLSFCPHEHLNTTISMRVHTHESKSQIQGTLFNLISYIYLSTLY
jgi:hypothetical protein